MGGQFVGDGDLHIQVPQYVCVIHCDAAYNVPLPGGGAEAEITGPQEVLGAECNGFCGPVGDKLGVRGKETG